METFKSIHHTAISYLKGDDENPDNSFSILENKKGETFIIKVGDEYLIEKDIDMTYHSNKISTYSVLFEVSGKVQKLHIPSPFRKYFYTKSEMRGYRIDQILD